MYLNAEANENGVQNPQSRPLWAEPLQAWWLILQIVSFVDLRDNLCLNGPLLNLPWPAEWCVIVCSPHLACVKNKKSGGKLYHFPFKRRLSIWVKSAVGAEAYLNKFLQISSLATVHTQACHFPRNRRVVKITAFEEWKFTHCLFLNRSSNKIAIW